MSNLPYLIPDNEFEFNIARLLMVINYLSKTKRGKSILNNEKLMIFLYLIRNPLMLNKVLRETGKEEVYLYDSELYSVASLSVNVDPLFDRHRTKALLKASACYGYIKVNYSKADGFLYELSDSGLNLTKSLDGEYYHRLREYLGKLQSLQAESANKLNNILNSLFKRYP